MHARSPESGCFAKNREVGLADLEEDWGRSRGGKSFSFALFYFCCFSFCGWEELTKELKINVSAKEGRFLSPATWASADNPGRYRICLGLSIGHRSFAPNRPPTPISRPVYAA